MSRKANKVNTAKRKDQILKAAVSAFSRKGLRETSMDDIVRESGVSKGAIYWYFKSKDELITKLMDTFFNLQIPKLQEIANASGSAVEQMKRLLDIAVKEMKKMIRFRPILQELYVLALRDRTMKKIARKEYAVYGTIIESIVKKGINQGEFIRVKPDKFAVSVISIFEGTLLLWSIDAMDIEIEKQLTTGVNYLIDAIRK